MKIKLLCLVIFFNFSVYATSNEILNESQIHKNLRCLVCQGQSIADSNSEFAQTLKMVVKDLINQGFEVKSYAINNIETANGLYILLFVTVLQKDDEEIYLGRNMPNPELYHMLNKIFKKS